VASISPAAEEFVRNRLGWCQLKSSVYFTTFQGLCSRIPKIVLAFGRAVATIFVLVFFAQRGENTNTKMSNTFGISSILA
jgi:hypothetical protein